MSDPLFDQINAQTLQQLRDGLVYDAFFRDNPLTKTLKKSYPLAVKRMIAMGVSIDRAVEIYGKMVENGVIKPEKKTKKSVKFTGGTRIHESITYAKPKTTTKRRKKE